MWCHRAHGGGEADRTDNTGDAGSVLLCFIWGKHLFRLKRQQTIRTILIIPPQMQQTKAGFVS